MFWLWGVSNKITICFGYVLYNNTNGIKTITLPTTYTSAKFSIACADDPVDGQHWYTSKVWRLNASQIKIHASESMYAVSYHVIGY